MIRRIRRLWPLAAMVLLLAGCGSTAPITEERKGVWDTFFVGPLSDLLDLLAKWLFNEYGLAILVLTIIIRLLILPLTIKQLNSTRKMQELQPELQKIQKKYKDDVQKQQQEMMKLYQQHNINPMAGCLPLLIQMPILVALYNAIYRNPAIAEHNFLWLQLGEPDPYYILPIIAALTTFLQSRISLSMSPNAQQQKQMQVIFMIFPIMIFVMSMQFAAALPLYWIYSNLFSIVQTYYLYRPAKHSSSQKAEVTNGDEKARRHRKDRGGSH